MNIIRTIRKIGDWAIPESRDAFVVVRDGVSRIITMNASIDKLASMLTMAMKTDDHIAEAVHKAVDIYNRQSSSVSKQ